MEECIKELIRVGKEREWDWFGDSQMLIDFVSNEIKKARESGCSVVLDEKKKEILELEIEKLKLEIELEKLKHEEYWKSVMCVPSNVLDPRNI